jgi:hypothetical protein
VKISFGTTRILTSGALVGLMTLAALGFHAQEKDMEGLRAASQESIYWSASQSEAELARFLAALGRYSIGDTSLTEAEVNKRFDIVWSRMLLFRQGDVGRRMTAYDNESHVIDEIDHLLRKHEAIILNLRRPGQDQEHRKILAEFTDAGVRVRAVSVRILGGEEAGGAGGRGRVRASAGR